MENHLRQQVQQWANQRAQWQKLAAAQQRCDAVILFLMLTTLLLSCCYISVFLSGLCALMS